MCVQQATVLYDQHFIVLYVQQANVLYDQH